MDSVIVLIGETELGKTCMLHLGGPLGTRMFNEMFEHGWGLDYVDGVILFAPAWVEGDPLEIHAALPWKPDVWGIQDGNHWMSFKDNGETSEDLRHGDGNLLELTSTLPVVAEA